MTRLRVLEAVARHGSVTAAARALNYAQPSVSHHLARLEAETGATLIQRAGRGIRLTDAGRLLAERAAEILGRLDAAENELAAHVGLRQGGSGWPPSRPRSARWSPPPRPGCGAGHPGIDLMLTEAEPPEALRMLRAGYVDVAVIFRHEHPQSARPRRPTRRARAASRSWTSPLPGDSRLGDAPPAAQPGADGPALTDYAAARWIAGCERCREHLLQQCEQAGFAPRIAFTTDDYVAVQALVAAGLGVTTLPGLALRAARHPGVRAEALPGARRQVAAHVYGAPPDPPAVSLLLEVLADALGGGSLSLTPVRD